MDRAKIKNLRTASLLKELIPEALANCDDTALNGLVVLDVECKKGRYDAFVYIDASDMSEEEKAEILGKLKVARAAIEQSCLVALGMFRCPKLHFKLDESITHGAKIEALFKQIESERASQNASKTKDEECK